MPRFAAFLRGMNVGGHRIANDDLRSEFEAIGLGDVRTFRASGNVIFEAEGETPAKLGPRIEQALEASLGYAVPTFVRTEKEVLAIADREPFDPKLVEASDGKLQVAFLSQRPRQNARREAQALATDEDRLELTGRELYWLPSGGILDSALDLDLIGKLLGPITMRTKGTIEAIAATYFAG